MRVVHQQEGAEHGKGQWDRDDQDAAEVQQEDDMRERDQDDLLNQRMPERIDGGLDQLRSVVKRNYMHARRQAWLDLLDLLFYAVDHFLRILASPCHDYAANRLG